MKIVSGGETIKAGANFRPKGWITSQCNVKRLEERVAPVDRFGLREFGEDKVKGLVFKGVEVLGKVKLVAVGACTKRRGGSSFGRISTDRSFGEDKLIVTISCVGVFKERVRALGSRGRRSLEFLDLIVEDRDGLGLSKEFLLGFGIGLDRVSIIIFLGSVSLDGGLVAGSGRFLIILRIVRLGDDGCHGSRRERSRGIRSFRRRRFLRKEIFEERIRTRESHDEQGKLRRLAN